VDRGFAPATDLNRVCQAWRRASEVKVLAPGSGAEGQEKGKGVIVLRVTPAMEAGVTDHVWKIEEILNL